MTESKKNDRQDHKLMWELLPLLDIEEVVKVYTKGAEKYAPNNWQNLPDGYNRYKAALFRHLVNMKKVIGWMKRQVVFILLKLFGML